MTMARTLLDVLPIQDQTSNFLSPDEVSRITITWYVVGGIFAVVGIFLVVIATVAEYLIATRPLTRIPGSPWLRTIVQIFLASIAGLVLLIPVTLEISTRQSARQRFQTITEDQRRSMAASTQQAAVVQQRLKEAREATVAAARKENDDREKNRIDDINRALVLLSSKDPAERSAGLKTLIRHPELYHPPAGSPLADLKQKILSNLDNHWKEICTNDQIANDVHFIYQVSDPTLGDKFRAEWNDARVAFLDPFGPDYRQLAINYAAEGNITGLQNYCERFTKDQLKDNSILQLIFSNSVQAMRADAVRVLLKHDVNPDTHLLAGPGTALQEACFFPDTGPGEDTFELLVQYGATVSVSTPPGRPLLSRRQ